MKYQLHTYISAPKDSSPRLFADVSRKGLSWKGICSKRGGRKVGGSRRGMSPWRIRMGTKRSRLGTTATTVLRMLIVVNHNGAIVKLRTVVKQRTVVNSDM